MHKIDTSIEINASPEAVWRVFSDFAAYGDWNPFIKELTGDIATGGRISIAMDQGDGKLWRIRPAVIAYEPGARLEWRGRLMLPGVFTGAHSFVLEELEGGRTKFRQEERFTGLLVPFFKGMLEAKTRPAFEAMNTALKKRVEADG